MSRIARVALAFAALALVGSRPMEGWPKRTIRLGVAADFDAVPRDEAVAALRRVASAYRAACGVDLRVVESPPYDVVARSDAIDGPWRVLAFAQFPAEKRRGVPNEQVYDRGEDWGRWPTPPFDAVALHETGHTLGLVHSEAADSVMKARAAHDLPFKLGRGDRARLRKLYGPPRRPEARP